MVAAVEGQGLGGRALAAPGWSTEAGGSRPLLASASVQRQLQPILKITTSV